MLEKQHQANIFLKWKPNWINLPGLDVVWFPNPGSPLVSRVSRGFAVSAVSGASAVFRVFKIYDPQTLWHDLSTWARCGLVSQTRFSYGFSTLNACCCCWCFGCFQNFCWSFSQYISHILRMYNVLHQDLDTIADVPAVFFIFVTFDICHETQLTNKNSKACK